jgi:two-component system LytT family response regulator
VHRSAIVRLDRVRELRTSSIGESALVLKDGTRVPVSRRRRETVAEMLRAMGR